MYLPYILTEAAMLTNFFMRNDTIIIVLHQNIQCVSNKFLNLEIFSKQDCDILLLTEHWQTIEQLNAIKLNNFTLINSYCRSSLKHGGVAMYQRDQAANNIELFPVNDFCKEGVLECCGVKLIRLKIIVLVNYRPPSGDFNLFLNLFSGILSKLSDTNWLVTIRGDFNIDFLSYNMNLILFSDLLACYNFVSTINSPTRVTPTSSTCIDNILLNNILTFQILLLNESWRDLFILNCPNAALEYFNASLMYYFDFSFPIKRCSLNKKPNNENWMTEELFELKTE